MAETLATGPPSVGAPSQTTFSYAQAAKSQTLPQGGASDASAHSVAIPSETKGSTDTMNTDTETTNKIPKEDESVNRELNGHTPNTSQDTKEILSDLPLEPTTVETPSQEEQDASTLKPSPLAPPTNVLQPLKQDDIFSSKEADTSWDKLSQHSQVEGSLSKTDGDTDDSKPSTWEHVEAPQLKEAPLPVVNIWQKRAQDLEAKALETKSANSHTTKTSRSVNHEAPLQIPKPKPDNGSSTTRNGAGSSKNTNGKCFQVPVIRLACVNDELGQSTHKANRTPENQKTAGNMGPPPPPNDTTSWPTPSLAKEEEKKKGQDRIDRNDNEKTPNRPHGKEKWEKVDYVPSAVFSTPLPPGRRGGRMGGRGGREGGTRGGHAPINGTGAVDRPASGPNSSAASSNATPPNERSRRDIKATVRGSGENGARRSVSTGPHNTREKPRGHDGSNDKREDFGTRQLPARPSRDNRRVSVSTQSDNIPRNGLQQGSDSFRRSSFLSDQVQGTAREHGNSRPMDRRGDAFFRSRDYPPETGGYASRERREGRAERGRGNWRSKISQPHGNMGGHGNQPPNGQAFGSSKFAYHQEQRHGSHPYVSSYGNGREPRHRTSSRSQSIPNAQGYSRFMNGGMVPAAHQLPPLQTSIANMYPYQAEHSGAMSAIAFAPNMERNQVHGLLQLQLEYYFSVNNLCRDLFLRERMDSQGFVFLHVLCNFNRMKKLQESLKVESEVIRFACYESRVLELVTGSDGLDRVRKAEGWEQWVLKMEARDPSAQNEGPAQLQSPTFLYPSNVPIYGSFVCEREPAPGGPMSARVPSSWNRHSFEPVPVGPHPSTGDASETQPMQTPLSANVPDFKPSASAFVPRGEALGDSVEFGGFYASQTADGSNLLAHQPTIFRSGNSPTHGGLATVNGTNGFPPPLNTTPNTGLSNGSLEQEHISTTSKANVLGSSPHDFGLKIDPRSLDSTTAALHTCSILRIDDPLALPSWHKQVSEPLADNLKSIAPETYSSFKTKALQSRELASIETCPPDMAILYHFWATYLFQDLNTAMYEEFRRLALADTSERDSYTGLDHLIDFYYEWLLGPNTIPDRLIRDFIDIVEDLSNKRSNSALHALRAAWRSDGLHCKNRVKVQSLLNEGLKASLESLI